MTGDNVIAFPLRGPAGEPVDLWRTFVSHGVAYLPPLSIDEERRTLDWIYLTRDWVEETPP